MEIPVLLFASLRDAAGSDRLVVAVDGAEGGTTVSRLLEASAAQCPALAPWLPHVRVAVNHEYARPETQVGPLDEIAFIPPVSGGCVHSHDF